MTKELPSQILLEILLLQESILKYFLHAKASLNFKLILSKLNLNSKQLYQKKIFILKYKITFQISFHNTKYLNSIHQFFQNIINYSIFMEIHTKESLLNYPLNYLAKNSLQSRSHIF